MSDQNRTPDRDGFRSRWGFKLACVDSAVGMGNIWLFPTRMSRYGAAFLIPYILFVILIASTGVIGEMAFGRAAGGCHVFLGVQAGILPGAGEPGPRQALGRQVLSAGKVWFLRDHGFCIDRRRCFRRDRLI